MRTDSSKTRSHIQIINELEKKRGGNGGNPFMINGFLQYLEGLSDKEIMVLDAYADTLKGMSLMLLQQRAKEKRTS